MIQNDCSTLNPPIDLSTISEEELNGELDIGFQEMFLGKTKSIDEVIEQLK